MPDSKQREVAAWLEKADNDLRGARIDMTAEPPLVDDALFHCQQAAEKAMKAFLVLHDVTFRKIHDLDELATACERIDSSLAPVFSPARDLTVFAWKFRYPGDSSLPPIAEVHASIDLADAVVAAVRQRS
ncbi:MAG: HEPN domain-containing protein [Kiritimatiellia bacterium]